MLFPSVFQTFHRKNDHSVILRGLNPEGSSGSYLCDITLPAFLITCYFFFLWNKENKLEFLPGDKKSKFLLFLRSIFLNPVFFCSFLIPFMENLIIFIKSISYTLFFVDCRLHHAFSQLSYFSVQLSCSSRKLCIMIKIFCFISSS